MSQQSSWENPQTCLQPVFDLLNKVATERKEGCCRVCEVLALDPTISCFLQERENEPIDKAFSALLKDVSNIVQECAVKRTIADWPFENFWGNPDEPKHSKMLEYFINPQMHRYGVDLLKELLKVCGKTNLVVDRHCEVKSEKDHIDILVIRKAQDCEKKDSNNNYAIIFENKINWAIDQPGADGTKGQLDTYVEVMKKDFEYKNIHVFYLPLRADKDPKREDKEAIIDKGVNYKKITFENEILRWLKYMADKETVAIKEEGMLDSLTHYKNLTNYLINKNKESNMKTKIFQQLKNIDDGGAALPSLEAALRAKEAVDELVPCLQIYKTLKAVEAEIRKEPQTEIEKNFPYDDGEAVGVKVSGVAATLWFGYDVEDKTWFFACQHIDENAQCLKPFDKESCWHEDKHLPYKVAGDVIGGGIGFNTPDLSQATEQMAAKKLLEMARSFDPKPKISLPAAVA